ncbi:hypothetical protein VIGAN_10240200 [Vigna angularis var. angularis]|uniref:Uncharacterized protein n=1 Tax=Vigna angularis var. angularis TaxID=157739 RepID=A0A0S3T7J8_PHAAN|nr:hypothetical protein VIGAN_10240200 [Vigna angularis var. angularis]
MFISSGSKPSSSFHRKELIKEPNIRNNILVANSMPGHIRLPPPKGVSSKFLPLTSMSDSRNLSGQNEFGFSQMLESFPIVHTFTSTCASFGIV